MEKGKFYKVVGRNNLAQVVAIHDNGNVDLVVYFVKDSVLQHNWTTVPKKTGKRKGQLSKLELILDFPYDSLSEWLKEQGM